MISFLHDYDENLIEPCFKLDLYYQQWVDIANKLVELDNSIIEMVDNLPLLELIFLNNIYEKRYAYVILSMIAQKYIIDGKDIIKLPKNIAIPLFNISKELGLPPIITHAGLDLWNWRFKNTNNKSLNIENLELIHSFTGTESEATFYLLMTEIEYLGKFIVKDLLNLPHNLSCQDEIFLKLSDILGEICVVIDKMYVGCDPNIFYNQLRKYLTGWNIIFEGISDEPFKFSGGSAAQSSLIQIFDIALKVSHEGTSTFEFLQNMRFYMPENHRKLLIEYENIMKKTEIQKTEIYLLCIEKLKKFRKKHYGLVHHYILKMQQNEGNNILGTGGTELKSFLNQCIKNTYK